MKKILSLLTLIALPVFAQRQDHPAHNMLLYGTQETFASHIVYLQPHNYQVILDLKLTEEAKTLYLSEKALNPNDTFIFFLDPMEIALIASAESISGKLIRKDAEGTRHVLMSEIVISKENFKLIFFNELPLSLEAHAH